jgi:frataxin
MDENAFEQVAEEYLEALADMVEDQDEGGALEAELQGGILTIALESGQQFMVNKHTPSQQIWLSSPISGGWHFDFADVAKLSTLLAEELRQLTQVEFAF